MTFGGEIKTMELHYILVFSTPILTQQRTSNSDQIFNHLYLENEKTFIRCFFCLSSHHHQLPFFFPNLFQNHPVYYQRKRKCSDPCDGKLN
jgi:hypothetical protein